MSIADIPAASGPVEGIVQSATVQVSRGCVELKQLQVVSATRRRCTSTQLLYIARAASFVRSARASSKSPCRLLVGSVLSLMSSDHCLIVINSRAGLTCNLFAAYSGRPHGRGMNSGSAFWPPRPCTDLSLGKAPGRRAVHATGRIVALPVLGGVHRQCVRI